jgi:hypothetical protein
MIRKYSLYIALLLIAGCAQLGLQLPQTFDQKLAYAYGTHTAVQKAAAASLNAKEITSDEAKQVLKLSDESRMLLDAAAAASAGGDISSADGKLLLATSILTQLQSYLRSK